MQYQRHEAIQEVLGYSLAPEVLDLLEILTDRTRIFLENQAEAKIMKSIKNLAEEEISFSCGVPVTVCPSLL